MKQSSDDYLWDGSGEPDPEIERLELLLERYRYKPSAAPIPSRPRGAEWPKLAAAAAFVLLALAGLWIGLNRPKGEAAPSQAKAEEPLRQEVRPDQKAPAVDALATPDSQRREPGVKQARGRPSARGSQQLASTSKAGHRPAHAYESKGEDVSEHGLDQSVAYLDAETMEHLERAQIVLRSFRNARITGDETAEDVAYEKERSRGLLYRNIRLRRDAEAKGDRPAEEILGSLEPFLLDIANLPDRPSKDDLRAITERMRKKEIVATLQVYSAQTLSVNF